MINIANIYVIITIHKPTLWQCGEELKSYACLSTSALLILFNNNNNIEISYIDKILLSLSWSPLSPLPPISIYSTLTIHNTLFFTSKEETKICIVPVFKWDSLVAHKVRGLPTMKDTQVRSLSQEDLEKEMATYSSILAWKIPWNEELAGLYSPWVTKNWIWLHFHFVFK